MSEHNHGFNTQAIHAGQAPDPLTGAVIPPIYQTSTFVQDGINVLRNGHEYSRGSNPTRSGFETQLTTLEEGTPDLPSPRASPRRTHYCVRCWPRGTTSCWAPTVMAEPTG